MRLKNYRGTRTNYGQHIIIVKQGAWVCVVNASLFIFVNDAAHDEAAEIYWMVKWDKHETHISKPKREDGLEGDERQIWNAKWEVEWKIVW